MCVCVYVWRDDEEMFTISGTFHIHMHTRIHTYIQTVWKKCNSQRTWTLWEQARAGCMSQANTKCVTVYLNANVDTPTHTPKQKHKICKICHTNTHTQIDLLESFPCCCICIYCVCECVSAKQIYVITWFSKNAQNVKAMPNVAIQIAWMTFTAFTQHKNSL